jgi:hypothetical protein
MADPEDGTGAAGVDARLLALEVKASFTDDLVDELNRTIARQQQQLEALRTGAAAAAGRGHGRPGRRRSGGGAAGSAAALLTVSECLGQPGAG